VIHFFDTIAPDAVFEFRYRFPGWPTKLVGREALMALYAVWRGMALHGSDALVVTFPRLPASSSSSMKFRQRIGSGKLYENRFISVVTDLKIGRLWVGPRLHGLAGGDVLTNLVDRI